ncbi:MAG TPA: long-chain fatty acid--CoA ligase [Spirochaetota bacterium]|nr:long-chain fatty acid--CoA ligase [Spirochaetota bacterium]
MPTVTENSMAMVFKNQVAKLGDKPCAGYKKDGAYYYLSWNEMDEKVRNLGYYLMSIGVKKGDRVALFSPNRYEWWIADLAILSIGAVNVPIYATNSSEESHYVLDHSESKVCLVGTESHLDRVLAVKKRLKKLKTIIIFDKPKKPRAGVLTLQQAYDAGARFKNKNEFDKRLNAIKRSDIATIIYTSGTTGNPKGVMLSHGNFIANVDQIREDFESYLEQDLHFMSFLPLSHSLERTAGYYLAIGAGARVSFADDFSTLMTDMQLARPTIIISVPRLYEKIHAGILSKAAEVTGVKKALFNFAMSTSAKNMPYVCENRPRTGLFAVRYAIADKLILSKIKAALGLDKLILAISGGGPLSVSDAEFFLGMGLVILEGFGLTETTPVTNVNRPGEIKPGSVGRPMKDTTIKISDEGEILIKGPQVMLGYYRNKKATEEAFTKDGFFRTGDIGIFDDRGRMSITGRIKDIIVTAGGKNISPQNIENTLKGSKFIEQVAVIGDKRKYLSALVIPAFEEVKKWATKQGLRFNSNDEMIANDAVHALIAKEIEMYMMDFARVEQIRKFRLLNAEWTQATDELTPTLKVKRRVIEKKYAPEIESMYPVDSGD